MRTGIYTMMGWLRRRRWRWRCWWWWLTEKEGITKGKAPFAEGMITSVFQPERWTQPSPPLGDKLNPTLPPDTVLVLEGGDQTTKLFAHRFVLAYYSGYFRALFASYKGFEVHISNVDPTVFSILLNYMYTGLLPLTSENVYDVLIASNFLYILPIVDLCKEYLTRAQRRENARTTSVIRPVPRRTTTFVPTAPAPPSQTTESLRYQPLRINNDDCSSIFKPVRANFPANLFVRTQFSTTSPPAANERVEETLPSGQQRTVEAARKNDSKSTTSTEKIIYDIACCDGPIKFQKVVNQFYKPWKTTNEARATTSHAVAGHDYKSATKNYRGRQQQQQLQRKSSHDASFPFEFQKIDDDATSFGVSSEAKLSSTASDNENDHRDDKISVGRNASKNDVPIQYYPCKSCGSKFPSYYFVNKHRKLCHANESDTFATKD